MSWWKQILGWGLTGFRPRCDTCGEVLEVKRVDLGGTLFECVDKDDIYHHEQGDLYRRWTAKVDELQAEMDREDCGLTKNYARQHYGRIKIEVRRRN